jgi:hypothetical protein
MMRGEGRTYWLLKTLLVIVAMVQARLRVLLVQIIRAVLQMMRRTAVRFPQSGRLRGRKPIAVKQTISLSLSAAFSRLFSAKL